MFLTLILVLPWHVCNIHMFVTLICVLHRHVCYIDMCYTDMFVTLTCLLHWHVCNIDMCVTLTMCYIDMFVTLTCMLHWYVCYTNMFVALICVSVYCIVIILKPLFDKWYKVVRCHDQKAIYSSIYFVVSPLRINTYNCLFVIAICYIIIYFWWNNKLLDKLCL